MDYEKHYNNLINKRRCHQLSKKKCYCERHHIIPKSLGGSNSSFNLVNLTAKEHFVAHRLLEKISCQKYGQNSEQHRHMAQALWLMIHNSKYPNVSLTPRSYEHIKSTYAQSVSGVNNRQYMKRGSESKLFGRKHSVESNQRNRDSHIGRIHMHNPITDEGLCVKREDINMFLSKGYLIGMSQHERRSLSKRNCKQKHMYHPITNDQVYAQPKDVQMYLNQGYVFGRSPIVCKKHNDKLKGRFAFYDKDTHKKFFVNKCDVEDALQHGHIISKRAKRKLYE